MKFGMQVEKHYADGSKEVKIETGSRISIWRPFIFYFQKPEVVLLSQQWIEIGLSGRDLV